MPLRCVHSTSSHSTLIDVELSTTGGYSCGVPGGPNRMKGQVIIIIYLISTHEFHSMMR